MRSLVIDDEFVALSKLVSLLAPLGPADAVTSGQQAMAMFRKALEGGRPYDLVTIDIEMPDINGIVLLGRLQWEEQARHGPPAKKVMVTATSSPSRVKAAAAGKCDAYLVKPVLREVLMKKLANMGLIPSETANPVASPVSTTQDVAK